MVLHNLIICLIFDLIRMRQVPPVPLKASKWEVVMFDKKISQLFPLPFFFHPLSPPSFPFKGPLQLKTNVTLYKASCGEEIMLTSHIQMHAPERQRALYLVSVKASEALSPEWLPHLCVLVTSPKTCL